MSHPVCDPQKVFSGILTGFVGYLVVGYFVGTRTGNRVEDGNFDGKRDGKRLGKRVVGKDVGNRVGAPIERNNVARALALFLMFSPFRHSFSSFPSAPYT